MTSSLIEATPEQVGLSRAGLDAVDAAVQAQVDAGVIPGAVTLVARHGKVCHVRAMGMKDIAASEPPAADTIYRIFSMTKPVTAAAMMILWDEGLWKPEDALEAHLPEFADAKVFVGRDEAGALVLEAADHPPTLLELLTHTAGLVYGTAFSDPNDPVDAAYRAAGVWEAPDLAGMMERLGPLPLAYQPGSSWRYSIGMDVQGALIEKLSGQSLPEFMRTTLFEPLGMTDTAFHTPPEKRHRLAQLYFKGGDAPLAPIANLLSPDYDAPPALASGGGGLVSTVGDYARFAQMLLGRGEARGVRVMSEAAARLMTTNHLPQALMKGGFLTGHQKIRPGFGMGFNGVVFTDPNLAGVPVGRGTYHWDGAAGTWFWIDPENDLLFVGLSQHLSYAAPALQAQTQTLMAKAFREAPDMAHLP